MEQDFENKLQKNENKFKANEGGKNIQIQKLD